MTTAQLVAFCGVVGLGAMSPGPDFAVVVRRAALRGRAEGMVVITLLWFCTVANLVAGLRRLFARSPVRRALDGLSGAALLGLGARLALVR